MVPEYRLRFEFEKHADDLQSPTKVDFAIRYVFGDVKKLNDSLW